MQGWLVFFTFPRLFVAKRANLRCRTLYFVDVVFVLLDTLYQWKMILDFSLRKSALLKDRT